MPQCVVIADDLTGANATGVLISKLNYISYTVMNAERLELTRLSESDCVLYPTDSRSVHPEVAYNRVYNVAKLLKDDNVKVYAKRIDSTLRGNLGSETDALLDALDNDGIAMVVPCFPEAKRILVGGYLLVNTVPLHRTEVTKDPKTPVNTSLAQQLYQEQSKYPVASIYLNDLMLGKEHLVKKILEYKDQGIRTIIFDSVSQEDMDLIATAVIESKVNFITVDPGSFTAAVTRKLIMPRTRKSKYKILATIGSVSPVAKTQLDELFLSQSIFNVFVKTKNLLEDENVRQEEINRVVKEVLDNCGDYEICSVVGDGIMYENRIDFTPYAHRYKCTTDEVSNRINSGLADITYQILSGNHSFQGIYTSGGDVTISVSNRLGASGINLIDEVLPLAAYGEFIAGEFDGLKIITKGGMAGDKFAMTTCMRYLKEKLLI